MIKIDYLKNHSEIIPELATIWYEVLGKIWVPDVPIERVHQKYKEHLNDLSMPLTFVAFDGIKPVGMCSLRENDGIRPDLTPWLGSLVVTPAYQKQGIAALLIKSIKTRSIELGFKKLYLFAFDFNILEYYEKQGWKKIATDQFKNYPVTIMELYL